MTLDDILVRAACSTCGAQITAPYVQVRASGLVACGCGTATSIGQQNLATQALLALMTDGNPVVIAASDRSTPTVARIR